MQTTDGGVQTQSGGFQNLNTFSQHASKIRGILSFIGTSLCILALFLNELSSFYDDEDDTDANGHCGWNSQWASDDESYFGVYFSYYCDDPDDIYDETQDDGCEALGSGIAWLLIGIFAALIGVISIITVIIKQSKYAKVCDIIAGVLCIGAIIAFFIDNGLCWDDDLRDESQVRLGASIYCMIFAGACSIIGGIIGFF